MMALEDLSQHELEMGCRRVLRRWNYTVMPPPAFIRECVCGALEEERVARKTEYGNSPREKEIKTARLTLEEAWEDWQQTEQMLREIRANFEWVGKQKKIELRKVYNSDLVLATQERVAELEKQKKEVLEKYGKGAIVRVRDSAPPEGNEGTGGKE